MDTEQNTMVTNQESAAKPRIPKHRIVMIVCAVVFVMATAGLIFSLVRQSNHQDSSKDTPKGTVVTDVKSLQGNWRADDVTRYTFENGGKGKLSTAVAGYDFSYTLQDGTVSVKFSDAAARDADFTCYLDGDNLTMTDNASKQTYKLTRQK